MCNAKLIISSLGGPSKVARDYGFSVQRVCNWGMRGIPPAVLVDYPQFAKALADAGYQRNGNALQAS